MRQAYPGSKFGFGSHVTVYTDCPEAVPLLVTDDLLSMLETDDVRWSFACVG